MESGDFIKKFIFELSEEKFEELKTATEEKYLKFSFIEADKITREIYAEKLYDYFLTVRILKTKQNNHQCIFDDMIDFYLESLSSIIKKRILLTTNGKKEVPESRAQKYYDWAQSLINNKEIGCDVLIDYSRVMFCLYMASINNNGERIDNFNLDSSIIDYYEIIEAYKQETKDTHAFWAGKEEKRFDTSSPRSFSNFTFLITIIIAIYIQSIHSDIFGGN